MGQLNLRKSLAKNLKARRGNLTQRAYAKKIGISKSTLNGLEQCNQNVTISTLQTLCRNLDCEIGDLFSEDVEK